MAATRILYLAFGFMIKTSGPLELGVWKFV